MEDDLINDFGTDKRPVILYDGVCNLCNNAGIRNKQLCMHALRRGFTDLSTFTTIIFQTS